MVQDSGIKSKEGSGTRVKLSLGSEASRLLKAMRFGRQRDSLSRSIDFDPMILSWEDGSILPHLRLSSDQVIASSDWESGLIPVFLTPLWDYGDDLWISEPIPDHLFYANCGSAKLRRLEELRRVHELILKHHGVLSMSWTIIYRLQDYAEPQHCIAEILVGTSHESMIQKLEELIGITNSELNLRARELGESRSRLLRGPIWMSSGIFTCDNLLYLIAGELYNGRIQIKCYMDHFDLEAELIGFKFRDSHVELVKRTAWISILESTPKLEFELDLTKSGIRLDLYGQMGLFPKTNSPRGVYPCITSIYKLNPELTNKLAHLRNPISELFLSSGVLIDTKFEPIGEGLLTQGFRVHAIQV